MFKLFTLFVALPLLELYLLVTLSDALGLLGTLLLVVITGAVGAALAQSEGLRVMRKWQSALASGRMPEEGVIGGALVLLGGILLVTPGPVTDLVGLLLLLPLTRRYFLYMARAHLQRKLREGSVRVFSYNWNDGEHGATFTGRHPHTDAGRHDLERAANFPAADRHPRSAHPVRVDVIDTDGESID